MEKCFNIAGPCFPDEHYMLPALVRELMFGMEFDGARQEEWK